MGTITRLTTWSSGDTLTAAALNAEFNNIVNDYNGGIANANIASGAAITYSKLVLTGGIVNADVSASAAITYSKLSLTGGIVNADISASAAIVYSKLSLTGGIVNADISGSAAIALSKINTGLSGSVVGTSDSQTLTTKVITSATNTVYPIHDICARVTKNDAQTITTGTWTKVQFDDEDYDPNSNYDNATNHRYVAPVAGKYLITAGVGFTSLGDGKAAGIAIYKNGSIVSVNEHLIGVSSNAVVRMSDILDLAATDYVEIFAQHNHGSNRDTQNNANVMTFAVHFLSTT